MTKFHAIRACAIQYVADPEDREAVLDTLWETDPRRARGRQCRVA